MKRFSVLFSLLFLVAIVGCGEEDVEARYADDPNAEVTGEGVDNMDTTDPTALSDQEMGDYAKKQPGSEGTPVDQAKE